MYVEQLYKIFVEYHLISEEETDAPSPSAAPLTTQQGSDLMA